MSAGGDALGDAIKAGLDAQALVDPQDRQGLMRAMGNPIYEEIQKGGAIPAKHALNGPLHTSTIPSGRLMKADANGLPVAASNTDAEVAAAVSGAHSQFVLPRQATAVSAMASTTAAIVGVTNTSAPRTITLPTSQVAIPGRFYFIVDESGGADANPITVVGEGGELINGAASQSVYGEESLALYSTGTAWRAF